MQVLFNTPLNINVTTAQLVTENEGQGTVQFAVLGQPVRLYVPAASYTYISDVYVGDRVQLIQNFAGLGINSNGIVKEIKVDSTNDQALVFFDQIYPDKVLSPIEVDIVNTKPTVSVLVPLGAIRRS